MTNSVSSIEVAGTAHCDIWCEESLLTNTTTKRKASSMSKI